MGLTSYRLNSLHPDPLIMATLSWFIFLIISNVSVMVCKPSLQYKFGYYEARLEQLESLLDQPFFARVNNVTRVMEAETAYLPCRIKNLRDGFTVTWLRVEDSRVLSVWSQMFSTDSRLSVIHIYRPIINADDWTLIINNTRHGDEGRYECSVNTVPKKSSLVTLEVNKKNIEVDKLIMRDQHSIGARILGPKSQYVAYGSSIVLKCRLIFLFSVFEWLFLKYSELRICLVLQDIYFGQEMVKHSHPDPGLVYLWKLKECQEPPAVTSMYPA